MCHIFPGLRQLSRMRAASPAMPQLSAGNSKFHALLERELPHAFLKLGIKLKLMPIQGKLENYNLSLIEPCRTICGLVPVQSTMVEGLAFFRLPPSTIMSVNFPRRRTASL